MNPPLTPDQLSLISAVDSAACNYREQTGNKPTALVLSHDQYMIMRQPHTMQGMHVVVAYKPDPSLPRCEVLESLNIGSREHMQKAFEEDCSYLRPALLFTMTSAGTYVYAATRKAFEIYRLGYGRSVKDHV